MILETILSLSLIHNNLNITPHYIFAAYSSRSSSSYSSSSRSSSSYSRPSSYSSSSRSSSSYSRPSIYSSSSKSYSSPKIYSPPKSTYNNSSSSFSSPVRITKQVETPKISPPVYTAPKVPTVPQTPAPRVVTRDRYITQYNNSGPLDSPWFWLYMMNNNHNNQPREVVVNNTEGSPVKIPENQMIVQKSSYNPVREFFVFLLGGGVGVFLGRKFSL